MLVYNTKCLIIPTAALGPTDGLNLLPETNLEKYRLQRRLFGPIYTTTAVKDHEEIIRDIVEKNLTVMHSKTGAGINIDIWMTMFAMG